MYEEEEEEEEEEEAEEMLVEQMALEQYDNLRGEDSQLEVSTFLAWEDILDVLDNGVIDAETMDVILSECGVTGPLMSFDQFKEAVDLVNQVTLSIEGDEMGGAATNMEWLPQEGEGMPYVDEGTVAAMLEAIGMRKRSNPNQQK